MKKFMKVIGFVLIVVAIGMIGYMIVSRYHADAGNVKIQRVDNKNNEPNHDRYREEAPPVDFTHDRYREEAPPVDFTVE